MYNKVRLKLNNYLSNGDQQPELQDGIRKDKNKNKPTKYKNKQKKQKHNNKENLLG